MMKITAYLRSPNQTDACVLHEIIMAEVHLLGQLQGAHNFKYTSLLCKYEIIAGQGWTLLEGIPSGQTHVDTPLNNTHFIFNQPLDLHFNTKSMQGWPKICIKVFEQDSYKRNILIGYGFTHIPPRPGIHSLEINCWQPVGSKSDEYYNRFLGTSVHLVDESLVYEPVDRFRLMTKSMGIVTAQVMVVIRNFRKQGIKL